MNHRIDQCFSDLKATNKTAFIAFITAGDPEPSVTVEAMHALVKGGANLIELGVPFSDPSADGASIQGSNERALVYGVGILDVLEMVRRFRQTDKTTPVVLMGYLNPIENIGAKEFALAAAKAQVDGLITVDLPPEESTEFDKVLAENNIYPIYLLAPTSTDERVEKITSLSKGFVYYVSVKGVTGSKEPDYQDVTAQLKRIRQYTDLPIAVGFGIKDKKSVTMIGQHADAVVVGSAIVNVMASQNSLQEIPPAVENFIKELTG